MSRFSGKCDLYDHISMIKTYDRGNCLVSDELECFNLFKEHTGGIIYQRIPLKLTPFNIDEEIKHVNNLKILRKESHESFRKDKRFLAGGEKIVTYTYFYYGHEYKSLDDLNKLPYCTTKEIKFDTLLDIIPYYPYLISLCVSNNNNKTYIEISHESFVDFEERDRAEYGTLDFKLGNYYRHELQMHYRDVVLCYFNPTGREIEETDLALQKEGSKVFIKASNQIDTDFDIELTRLDGKKTKPIYLAVDRVQPDLQTIDLSSYYLDSTVFYKINYVKKVEPKKYLG